MRLLPWHRRDRPQSKRDRPRIVVLIQAKPVNYVGEHPAHTTCTDVKHSQSFAKHTSSFAKRRPPKQTMEGGEEKKNVSLLQTASSATTLSATDSCRIVADEEALSCEIARSTFSTKNAVRLRSQLDQVQRQLKEMSSHLNDLSCTKNSASTATNDSDASPSSTSSGDEETAASMSSCATSSSMSAAGKTLSNGSQVDFLIAEIDSIHRKVKTAGDCASR